MDATLDDKKLLDDKTFWDSHDYQRARVKELNQRAQKIAKNAYLLHGIHSPKYNAHIMKAVHNSPRIQDILWHCEEYDRIQAVDAANMKICHKWMVDNSAPKLVSWQTLEAQYDWLKNTVAKKMEENTEKVNACCGEVGADEVVDLQGKSDIYNRQSYLDDEYEAWCVHDKIEMANMCMSDILKYTVRAAKDAKRLLEMIKYQFVTDEHWRKEMGLTMGQSLERPLSEFRLKEAALKRFPSRLDDILP